jgi:hypothetical protein
MNDPADDRVDRRDDDEPDPKLLWRWVGRAVRPYVGWILVGAGALLVLLGYFGVSREAIVGKQIPYLVSGGIGGVMLAVLGAYFLGTEELRRDSGRLDRLEQMVTELHEALLARADAPAPSSPTPNGSREPKRLVAMRDGDLYHREGCSMVEGKSPQVVAASTISRRGLQPCALCDPAAVTAG